MALLQCPDAWSLQAIWITWPGGAQHATDFSLPHPSDAFHPSPAEALHNCPSLGQILSHASQPPARAYEAWGLELT